MPIATKTKTKTRDSAPLLDGVIVDDKPKNPPLAKRAPPEPKYRSLSDLTTASGRMAAILSVMSAGGMDAATAREWRELYREMQLEDQERAFNEAMHAAQSEMPRIARDKQADRFKYATLEKVSREIDPVARKHGFVLSYGNGTPAVTGSIAMYVDVMHIAGATRRYHAPELKPDTTGLRDGKNKTDTQGAGAAITYMRRYLKCMVFDVAIEGEDIDGAKAKKLPPKPKAPTITQEQADALGDQCEAVGCPREKFLKHMNVAALQDIPADLHGAAVQALANYDAARREREKRLQEKT